MLLLCKVNFYVGMGKGSERGTGHTISGVLKQIPYFPPSPQPPIPPSHPYRVSPTLRWRLFLFMHGTDADLY
jgi:hypothetical protein